LEVHARIPKNSGEGDKSLLKISIVTPSFNQGPFLEQTIRSVLQQGYPNLEYIIVDGGSDDESVRIIKKYEKQLTYWVSEPDSGQYNAINKGFLKATGDIMAWINSDDMYTPWAFHVVSEIFAKFPQIEWLTTAWPLSWGISDLPTGCGYAGVYSSASFFKGANLPRKKGFYRNFIQQESTFWRRSLWERAGGRLNESFNLAGDFELWFRFFRLTDLYAVNVPLGGFRQHQGQKTARLFPTYLEEALKVLENNSCKLYGPFHSLMRRIFWSAFGRRSLKRLPASLASVLCRIGLLYRAPLCLYKGETEGWQIVHDYVI
jgi:glycosyltransferase involved in cell wall biosynthesis